MAGMAVYRTPPAPAAWAGADIVRIVDPLGLAIAWVVPALGGACIGFSVREDTAGPWRSVFESDLPDEPGDDAPLGIEPLVRVDDGTVVPARLAGMVWTMHERDPTGVIVGSPGHRDSPTVTVSCGNAGLEITLTGERFAGVRLQIPDAGILSGPDDTANQAHQPNSAVLVTSDAPMTIAWSPDLTISIDQAEAPRIDLYANHGRPHHGPRCVQLALRTRIGA